MNARRFLLPLALLAMLGLPLALFAQSSNENMVTLTAQAQLSPVEGRSIATTRQHHLIVDAPAPLGGPNEEINPIEMLLSSLATCGVLVSEKLAAERGIMLRAASTRVEGELDPRGVRGEAVDPRIQVFRVTLSLSGPTQAQAETFSKAFQQRCPIYATLVRAAPIDITVEVSPP